MAREPKKEKPKKGRGSGKPLAPERKAALAEETALLAAEAARGWKPHGADKYTPELGAELYRRLSHGETLTAICRGTPGHPSDFAVRSWALDPNHPFSSLYTRARELGYHKMADDLCDIADDGSNDWMERETRNGTIIIVDKEVVDRSRLRVETRKWLLSKALPKMYGDKQEVKHTGDDAFLAMLKVVSGNAA